MKYSFLFCLFILITVDTSQAQNRTAVWELGYNQGGGCFEFRFISQNLSIVPITRKMNLLETNASICDQNGNLLMYTNGAWIANSQHDTMANGGGINPGLFNQIELGNEWGLPSIQTALFLPDPADSMQYYLFHMVSDVYHHLEALDFMYTKIDMRLDSGRGAITAKNQVIFSDSLVPGGLTAVKHANGRDWWIISHTQMTDAFHILLLTPDGFTDHIQNIGNTPDLGGQAAFSPDGLFYAAYDTYIQNNLDILQFDRCTGIFSNYVHIQLNDSATGTGVSFSPDSRLLYVCSGTHVYQFDVTSNNIASTLDTVATYDGYYSPQPPFSSTFFVEQLAPDGKIYIASTNGVVDMHVVNNPNQQGIGCDLYQHSLSLPFPNGIGCLPNLVNYDLGPVVGSVCDTINGLSYIIAKPTIDVSYQYTEQVFLICAAQINQAHIEIVLSDILGKVVLTKKVSTLNNIINEIIPVENLSDGIYLLHFGFENGFISKRVAKF